MEQPNEVISYPVKGSGNIYIQIRPLTNVNKACSTIFINCVSGGAARGAAGGASLCVRDRERRHREESGDEGPAEDLPEHEAQTRVGRPQPKGRDQR